MRMKCFYTDRQGTVRNEGVQEYHYENADIYVDGLIYAYQKKAGQETADWLYEKFISEGKLPYEEIRGAYSCIIRCKGTTFSFSDNSGMHCIYYSDGYLSNSFLKISELEKKAGRKPAFNAEALCEYLSLGSIYFEKTFFAGIRILESTRVIRIRDGIISFLDKGIGDIDRRSDLPSLSDYFSRVAYSISGRKICQALTGGYDSRMVYACMSSKVNDHAAITSNDMANKDVRIASEVAEANGAELEIISIPKPEYTEDLISSILTEADGIQPLDFESFIRLSTFMRTLAAGHDILLTGDGGVLHKDWEWTQDLPFYRKKKNNPGKFYHQRICFVDISQQLGDAIREAYAGQEERFVNELTQIEKTLNTQSYDSWYYRVSGNRKTVYNHTLNSGIIMYAPLLELDAVRYSYALPRFRRFFYNSIRDTISGENIRIARIKTNYGTTASNEGPYLIRDVFYQLGEYIRKAYRLFGRKILNRNVLVNSHTGWSLENEIRESAIAGKALNYAKGEGLIRQDAGMESLSYELLTRIIHIYWLAREFGNEGD